MDKKILKLVMIAVCIGLVFAISPAWAAGSEAKAGKEEVKVTIRGSGFGSVAYTMATAIETMSLKEHPWLRLQTVESPGGGSDVVQLLSKKNWNDSIITLSALWDVYATTGVGGVEPKKKFPNARALVKDLVVMSRYDFMFVTLDQDIKTEQDLAGKKIGAGRIGQGVWGGLPTLAFEKAWPELKARVEYFSGPKGAIDALLDGKVDAAVMAAVVSPDLSIVKKTPALVDIAASGRKFYYVGFTAQGLDRFTALTSGVGSQKLPPGTLPGNQPQPLLVMSGVVPWAVQKDFPEELAYEFTKFYIQICGKLPKYHALAEVTSTPQSLFVGLRTENMHPGAVRAAREAGALAK